MYLLGECKLTSEDILFMAEFKHGRNYQMEWPCYYAFLQCPICARLAEPDDGIIRLLFLQVLYVHNISGKTASMTNNFCERLCCM